MLTGYIFRGVCCGTFKDERTFKQDDGTVKDSKKTYVGFQFKQRNKFGVDDAITEQFRVPDELLQTGFHRSLDSHKGKILEITFADKNGDYDGKPWSRRDIISFDVIEDSSSK